MTLIEYDNKINCKDERFIRDYSPADDEAVDSKRTLNKMMVDSKGEKPVLHVQQRRKKGTVQVNNKYLMTTKTNEIQHEI